MLIILILPLAFFALFSYDFSGGKTDSIDDCLHTDTPRHHDVTAVKTGTAEHIAKYKKDGNVVECSVFVNIYSLYLRVDGENRIMSSNVSTFNNEPLSYTDCRGDEPITYTISDSETVSVPEKTEGGESVCIHNTTTINYNTN